MVDLIIDGNFILSKLVFTLHKHNLLFGGLHKALETTTANYRKWYPFTNIYLVSDSREKSWRKDLLDNYKGKRKKDSDIDWSFVYTAYEEFKQSLKGIIVLESPKIEGDDWISFLVETKNLEGHSTIIVSNDYDIKQLVTYNLEPLFINIMTNEMYNKEKLFLPYNYQVFINKMSKLQDNDIFNLTDDSEFLKLLDKFINKYEIHEINNVESLITKVIAGDTSDNIGSVWSVTKNGRKRGIGDKGAQTIYEEYLTEFGEVLMDDVDLYENIADLICEKKKLPKSEIKSIVGNIDKNVKLIDLKLSNLPDYVVDKMKEIYESK